MMSGLSEGGRFKNCTILQTKSTDRLREMQTSWRGSKIKKNGGTPFMGGSRSISRYHNDERRTSLSHKSALSSLTGAVIISFTPGIQSYFYFEGLYKKAIPILRLSLKWNGG